MTVLVCDRMESEGGVNMTSGAENALYKTIRVGTCGLSTCWDLQHTLSIKMLEIDM